MDAGKQYRQPWVTVDVVVVRPQKDKHQVLLIRRGHPPFEGLWAIPGGFVEADEPLAAAARRELEEETGLQPKHLAQLHTFGDPGRDPRGWTISVAYLALLDGQEAAEMHPQAGSDAAAARWFDLDNLPPLAFDHADILALAAQRLSEISVLAPS